MAKDKVTLTIDPSVLATTDQDATDENMNRSQYVERVLRDAHYQRQLARASAAELSAAEDALMRRALDEQHERAA